jgi:hypothetical protein
MMQAKVRVSPLDRPATGKDLLRGRTTARGARRHRVGRRREEYVVPEVPTQPPLNQDLGLGGKLSERSRVRLLNRDGTFNVRRNNLSALHPYNAYHTLLSLPVPRLLALMIAGYIVTNLLFAGLFWLAGPDALAGAAVSPAARFEDCLFFSVQTLATIGYGKLVPTTAVANYLVALEAFSVGCSSHGSRGPRRRSASAATPSSRPTETGGP